MQIRVGYELIYRCPQPTPMVVTLSIHYSRASDMPIDLVCDERDSLKLRMRRRIDDGDAYFKALSADWSEGVRKVFRELPELEW